MSLCKDTFFFSLDFFEKSLSWEGRKVSQFPVRVLRTNSRCLHQPVQLSLTVKPRTSRCPEPGNVTQRSMEKSVGTQRSWKLLGLGLLLTWLDDKNTQQMPGGVAASKSLGDESFLPCGFSASGEKQNVAYSAEVVFWQPLPNKTATRASSAP